MALTEAQTARLAEVKSQIAAIDTAREQRLRQVRQEIVKIKQPTEPGFTDRVARGVDVLQATGGRAVQAFGEMFGADNVAKAGRRFAERQNFEADVEAPPIEGFSEDPFGFIGDALTEGIPSIGAIGAGAGVGAGIGSFLGPGGTVIGALVGLGATAFGMNIGTAKEIENALQPEAKADLGTFLTGSIATIPDVLAGGVLSQTVKSGIIGATKSVIAKRIATDTAVGIAATGANIAALDIGSTLSTDVPLDTDRIQTIAENAGNSMVVAAVGAPVISGSAAVLGGSIKVRNDAAVNSSPFRLVGDRVELVEPNPQAFTATDSLKKATTVIGMGRSVDELIATAPKNLAIRAIAAEFDTTFDERVRNIGKNTVNIDATLRKGDYFKISEKFNLDNLSKKKRAKVKTDIIEGRSSPVADSIRKAFRTVVPTSRGMGIRMGDMGDNFYPFFADIKKIRKNREEFTDEMLEASGRTGESLARFAGNLDNYIDRLLDEGSDLHLGESARIPTELLDVYDRLLEAGNSQREYDALIKQLQKPLKSVQTRGSINKNNHMEQHRFLSEIEGPVLNKWAKDIDISEVLDIYFQSVSERQAYAQRFGANNEKLHSMARLAQLEALEKGQPLAPQTLEKLYNIADIQQRITAKRVSPEYRARIRAIKTAMNVLTLPSAVLSSLAEPLLIAPKTGAAPFVKGGIKAVSTVARKLGRVAIKSIPRSEYENALQGMGTSLREAQSNVAARVGEDIINPTRIDQGLFKFNGLAAWTEFTRMWAQAAAIEHFKQDAGKIQNLALSTGVRAKAAQRIGEAGLDPNRVIDWVNAGAKQDAPMFREIQAGAINVAEDVVFNPKPVRKPIWMSDPTWFPQLFGQLKTFPITFTNRVAVPVANRIASAGGIRGTEQALKTATVGGVLTTAFIMQDALKAAMRDGNLDKWEDKTDKERIASAALQLGTTSLIADPIVAELHGGSALEAIAGPAIAKGIAITSALANLLFGDASPEDTVDKVVRELVPNVPGAGVIREELK